MYGSGHGQVNFQLLILGVESWVPLDLGDHYHESLSRRLSSQQIMFMFVVFVTGCRSYLLSVMNHES